MTSADAPTRTSSSDNWTMGLAVLPIPYTSELPSSPHSIAAFNVNPWRCLSLSSFHHFDSSQTSCSSFNSHTSSFQPFSECCLTPSAFLGSLLLKPRRAEDRSKASCTSKAATDLIPVENETALYDDFVEFAVHEVGQHTVLLSYPFQEELRRILAMDGKTTLCSNAFESSKIRFFRIATINGGHSIQVFNMAILPRPEYDLPIFCADFFSTSTKHIIVLDLNPLYNTEKNKYYKEKYYSHLMPLVNKYAEVLPWGQKLTTESLQFFSPLLIWSKPESRQDVQENVFLAFTDYLKAWLALMDEAEPSVDPLHISENQQAQHRYLLWRATKDPGRPLLHRLFGDVWCENYISEFLFHGTKSLGVKGFLDYFPEYRGADGSINKERSIIGKSCLNRPWDKNGNFIGS